MGTGQEHPNGQGDLPRTRRENPDGQIICKFNFSNRPAEMFSSKHKETEYECSLTGWPEQHYTSHAPF